MELRIAGTVDDSIVDGPGWRFVIFTQGCPHQCKGCQNPQTWPFVGGSTVNPADLLERIKANPLLQGVTFSGGEPFIKAEPLSWLARQVHGLGLDVWAYSGYTYEELQDNPLLPEVDVLVDGRFEIGQRDLTLRFRGSRNQRLIDVPQSINAGKVVLWTGTKPSHVA